MCMCAGLESRVPCIRVIRIWQRSLYASISVRIDLFVYIRVNTFALLPHSAQVLTAIFTLVFTSRFCSFVRIVRCVIIISFILNAFLRRSGYRCAPLWPFPSLILTSICMCYCYWSVIVCCCFLFTMSSRVEGNWPGNSRHHQPNPYPRYPNWNNNFSTNQHPHIHLAQPIINHD